MGLLVLMVALRGPAANHIATFWADVSSDKKPAILGLFKSRLTCLYHHEEVRQWLADHPHLLTEEIIRIAFFFDKHGVIDHRLHLDCLRVSELQGSPDFFSHYVEHFRKSNKVNWIRLNLEANPRQTRVSTKYFADVTWELTLNCSNELLLQHEDEIIAKPFCEWQAFIEELKKSQSELRLERVSANDVMNDFKQRYGEVSSLSCYKDVVSATSRANRVLQEVRNKPIEMQLGIAMYTTLTSLRNKHQLHTYPAGIGKDRIIHAIALYLLTHNLAKRVKLYTSSSNLSRRDRSDFEDYFSLSGVSDSVEYITSLEVAPEKGDYLIYDEADSAIFASPQKFLRHIQNNKAICFSATIPQEHSNKLE